MGFPVPFPNQDCSRRRSGASLIELSQPSCNVRRPTIPSGRLRQDFVGLGIQIAEAIGLDPVGKNSEQEIPGEMFRCCSSKLVASEPSIPSDRDRAKARSRPRLSAIDVCPAVSLAYAWGCSTSGVAVRDETRSFDPTM